jgi:L-lactate dehydrogenase complex protein LldG
VSAARDQILAGIRQALKRGPLATAQQAALTDRLVAPPRNLVPARASSLDHSGQVALFIAMAEQAQATVARCGAAGAAPGAIVDYLARHNLPSRIVLTPDPALDICPWGNRPMLEVRRGRAEDSDAVGVTACFAGIAETGTLMLLSGARSPTRNNFLPETHIVLLRRVQIVASYEDAWSRLRAERRRPEGGFAMPRSVNFITGPSRTADIEQRVELGAHGPRRVHIVLIDDEEPAAEE